MADNLTKEQRSKTMAKIKSKWTKQERTVHLCLNKKKIKHKMHPKIKGSPDLIIPEKKMAVFLHGCFWHSCKRYFVEPKSNRKYWINKINGNKKRDSKNKKVLVKNGWEVAVIWEHQIKRNLDKACCRLTK